MKKKQTKQPSGSLRIDPAVLLEAKKICKERGILLSFFGTEAVKEKVEKEKTK